MFYVSLETLLISVCGLATPELSKTRAHAKRFQRTSPSECRCTVCGESAMVHVPSGERHQRTVFLTTAALVTWTTLTSDCARQRQHHPRLLCTSSLKSPRKEQIESTPAIRLSQDILGHPTPNIATMPHRHLSSSRVSFCASLEQRKSRVYI